MPSTVSSQYVIQPPNVPFFLYRFNTSAWERMVEWAEKEFQARLRYCAEHGYWRELKKLNEESSPIRILAELHGFRKMCAVLEKSEYVWSKLSRRNRRFIRHAFTLRDLLMRQNLAKV